MPSLICLVIGITNRYTTGAAAELDPHPSSSSSSLCSDGGKPRSRLDAEGSPQREDPQQRLRWQAHLEFTHNHTVGDLTWELIDPVLPRSERLRSLVLGGIPHSMRPQVSGAAQREGTDPLIKRRRKKKKKKPRRLVEAQAILVVFLRQLWMRLSGALQKKRTSEMPYREIIKNSSNDDSATAKQVKHHSS